VQQLCDTVVWLERGTVKMVGSATDVISAYTGDTYGNFVHEDSSSKTRWGSGDAQVTQVTITDAAERPLESLGSGGELRLSIELNSYVRLESPVLHVRLETMTGELVWTTSTRRGAATLRVLDGPARAVLHVPHVPLAEGTYYVSVVITDATGGTEYDHCQHWAKLHVTDGQPNDGGIIAMASNWAIGRQKT
jgi:ABC-2 type transport system ATP-binding protein